jgi:hypothetical protein
MNMNERELRDIRRALESIKYTMEEISESLKVIAESMPEPNSEGAFHVKLKEMIRRS